MCSTHRIHTLAALFAVLIAGLSLAAPTALRAQSVFGHVNDEIARAPTSGVAVTIPDAHRHPRGTVLTDSVGACGVIGVWTCRAVVGEGLGSPFTVRPVANAGGFLALMTAPLR